MNNRIAFRRCVTSMIILLIILTLIPFASSLQGSTNLINTRYQITAYEISILPDVNGRTFKITCAVTVKALTDVNTLNFFLDPVWSLANIEGVKEFTQNIDTISFDKTINKGSSETFTFHYNTQLKGRDYPGRQWNYINDDGLYLYQWWYPVTLSTIAEGHSTIVSFAADINIPGNWIACTSDVVFESLSGDGHVKTVEIETRDPAFFYHIVAGPYKEMITEDPENVVSKVIFYGEEKYFDIGNLFSGEIFGALEYFENRFGTPAPLEYSVIQMPPKYVTVKSDRSQLFVPSTVLDEELDKVNDDDIDDEDTVGYTDPEYLAEKVAACWWGGAIYNIGPEAEFLTTSLSAYSGLLYMSDLEGEKKISSMLADARDKYFDNIEVEDEVPLVKVAEQELMDDYFTGKGLIIYHMLRQVIGDAAFFKGLMNYASRYSGKFSGIDDFEAEMSRASGQSLSWFFEQWLLQSGRLTYEIDFTKLPGRDPYRYKIRLEAVGTIKMPFKIDVIMKDKSLQQFEWSAGDLELEKIFESDIEPIGAKIHNPEGYMLTEFSKVNTLLEGSLANFYYLDDLTIIEGTWQGNEDMEKKAHGRALFVQKMVKEKFDREVPIFLDSEIDQDELSKGNFIMVGCTGCNALLAYERIMPGVPFWSTNWTRTTGPIFPGAGLPEGTCVFPNPLNPWRGIIQDEFFNSDGKIETINMLEDFYFRAPETGSIMKGYLHKRGKEYWEAPKPLIINIEDFDNNLETTENIITLEGESNTEFYITYNKQNPIVFGEPPSRIYVPEGEFEIEIDLLRGVEFAEDSLVINATGEGVIFERTMKNDFRGEMEPPVITFEDTQSEYLYGEPVEIEWKGRDNSSFYKDIQYSWSMDGGPRTSFKTESGVTLENLPDGEHEFRLWARDVRGNINFSIPKIQFTVK
jgi:hypothetical protein